MGKLDESYFNYGKAKFKRVMEENKEAYNNIDSDTRVVLEVIAKVKIPAEYKVVKNGEKRFEMCKAFEDYRLEGSHILNSGCGNSVLQFFDISSKMGIRGYGYKKLVLAAGHCQLVVCLPHIGRRKVSFNFYYFIILMGCLKLGAK